MPFMILEIITRIANVNSIREQNEKICDRLRHEKESCEVEKILPIGS